MSAATHGLIPVPRGQIGAVVTYLEMLAPPAPAPVPDSSLRLERWAAVDPERYRTLFAQVGARWLWFSRLAMADAALLATVGEVHEVIGPDGGDAGFVELDFRVPELCTIRFLGLAPVLAGKGHGRWLLAETLRLAWAPGVARVAVHTCSLDHPAALPAYLRAGFTAIGRAFESFPDPRLDGLLPRDAAPQLPLIER
ncbi:MAG TPA: GNAT family N-acetyltransferase [Allosphingosinicella sp.]|nr:GNAT family N-acetyltransferase [Allosphingosinicella sp.]